MSSMYSAYSGQSAQRCQRCAMPLPPQAGNCTNCGLYNAPAQADNATGQVQSPAATSKEGGTFQTAQGFSQFRGQQWKQPFVARNPGNLFNGASAPQQPFGTINNPPPGPQQQFGRPDSPVSFPQQPFGTPGQYQSLSPNNYAGTPQQSSNPTHYFGPPASQQPAYYQSAPPATQRGPWQESRPSSQPPDTGDFLEMPRRPKFGLILGIIVLLVILVGGGVFGYLYLNKSSSSNRSQTNMATAIPTPKGPALFSDSFLNNKHGWNLSSIPGKFSVSIGGGSLVLEDDNNKLLWELVPVNKPFSNFILDVDAVLSKGTQDNGYGVYIRGASNQGNEIATYYRFELYGDSTFAVFKGTVDSSGTSKSSTLVNFSVNAVIQKQGSLNHISIAADGSTMSFIVNGHTLSTFSDSSYTSGSIALFISNVPNTTPAAQATFSHLAVYPPQS